MAVWAAWDVEEKVGVVVWAVAADEAVWEKEVSALR